MGIIYFNGIPSTDVGLVVEHYPNYQYAEKEYEEQSVPGRNGKIFHWNGNYKNVSQSYDLAFGAQIGDDGRFFQMADNVVDWLHPFSKEQTVEDAGKPYSGDDYFRLSDSYNPDVYRLAVYKESGNIKNLLNSAGRITAKFDCKPQRFLVSGDEPIVCDFDSEENVVVLEHPTNYTSKPIIKISGVHQAFDLNVDGVYFRITEMPTSGNLTINCEDEEIYNDGTFYNNVMISSNGYFPELKAIYNNNHNTISWGFVPQNPSGIDEGATITIIPKWWTI